MNIPTKTLRKSIGESADVARRWFESRTESKSRKIFEAKDQLGDTREGAVYVYYGQGDAVLYVGQTNRNVKARLHDQTSPHKKQPWWSQWKTMRFVNLPDEMDRLVLEFMLILAYLPLFNEKPKAKNFNELLPD